jgi:hypothetical protein
MFDAIRLEINGVPNDLLMGGSKSILIKETDYLRIIIQRDCQVPPVIQFEDYEIATTSIETEMPGCFELPARTYFSESFGMAVVRIQVDGETAQLVFDVLAKKVNAEQAMRMIQYLAGISTTLIKACLARTALSTGSEHGDSAEPEAMLAMAEGVLGTLQCSRQELVANCRLRLVPTRLPRHATNKLTCEIDPVEVLFNLDALSQAAGLGDVALRGRNFDIGNIELSALQPTADVLENQILLGGLHSIRKKLLALHEQLCELPAMPDGTPAGYESFSRLLLTLTATSMIQRCANALRAAEGFIDLFSRHLGVTYHGELAPRMTPFVRGTRVYRALFTQLADWYAIGAPNLGNVQFMMKLKSLSRIYELFALYQVLETVVDRGWTLVDVAEHPEFGGYVPQVVSFAAGDDRLVVQYEPTIGIFGKETQDHDLIDVYHRASDLNPYFKPDFVLRLEVGGVVRYLIFDAKYSTAGSVVAHAIPKLKLKYYDGMAVYDAARNVLTNEPIVAVMAIYALDNNAARDLSYWPRQSVFNTPPRLPAVGGVGLVTDQADLFRRFFDRVLELARLSAHGRQLTVVS